MDGLHDLELREGEERISELLSTFNGGGRGFESEREVGGDETIEETGLDRVFYKPAALTSAALAAASNLLAAASSHILEAFCLCASRQRRVVCHSPPASGTAARGGPF